MARLTVTFKGKTIQHLPLETGQTSIGREPDNALQIDSLAVAPHHAIVDVEVRGMVLKQLDADFPLLVNGRKVTEHVLQDGDCIILGKHEIFFMDDDPSSRVGGTRKAPVTAEAAVNGSSSRPTAAAVAAVTASSNSNEAGLQLLNGKQIGLVIPLKNALTRLDRDVACSAVIARRTEGYFLASLASPGEENNISVNGNPIGDGSVKLNNGDMIKINEHKLRFFIGD